MVKRMFKVFGIIVGILLLLISVVSVLLLMIICAITFIPHLIYNVCAGILADTANIAINIEKDAEMREHNK